MKQCWTHVSFGLLNPRTSSKLGALSLMSTNLRHHGPRLNRRRNMISSIRCLAPRIRHLAQMGSRTLHGDYHPKTVIQFLENLMERMLAGTRAAPVQVGVWIPKAKLGPTADFFRPLGMPNTCDRLVDGTIAAVIMKATSAYMHPSQVVMNCFKEPQHAVNAIQTLLDGRHPWQPS